MVPQISASYFIYKPVQSLNRDRCPCMLVPSYEIAEEKEDNCRKLITQYTTMRIVHFSKNQLMKNCLDLAPIHYDLFFHSIQVEQTGSSHLDYCKFSFNCMVSEREGGERANIVFDLKIPKTDSSDCFGTDSVLNKYGNCSGQDQFAQHIIGYLVQLEASQVLVDRLRVGILNVYPNATIAKVYNIGLHLHTPKTFCTCCEYNVIGLMNLEEMFLEKFKKVARVAKDHLNFKFPVRSSFNLICTVSANYRNADHRSIPKFIKQRIDFQIPTFDISVKNNRNRKYIYTTFFPSALNKKIVSLKSSFEREPAYLTRDQEIQEEEKTDVEKLVLNITPLFLRRQLKLKSISLSS